MEFGSAVVVIIVCKMMPLDDCYKVYDWRGSSVNCFFFLFFFFITPKNLSSIHLNSLIGTNVIAYRAEIPPWFVFYQSLCINSSSVIIYHRDLGGFRTQESLWRSNICFVLKSFGRVLFENSSYAADCISDHTITRNGQRSKLHAST